MPTGKCDCDNDEFINGIRERMIDDDTVMELADFFKLFGDSTRLRILCALQESELCVHGISGVVGMSDSAVSHQLKALKDAKLIKGRREGKQIYYSLCDDHIVTLLNNALEHLTED